MANKSDVELLIAALDTEYQAAVKNNDAATMDRIRADDFILVTGRGKVYNQANLLDAAKNKDEQEDTQPTVRAWGDTAVITALLWQKARAKACHSALRLNSVWRNFENRLLTSVFF